MNKYDTYDVAGVEMHHKQKVDAPSGTAKIIGDILIKELDRKTTLVTESPQRALKPEELHVSAVRGGTIPGTHSVLFDSDFDTIELKHTARSRKGFALGAVLAAEWIHNKKGFFSVQDMM